MRVWTTFCLAGLLAACDSLPVASNEGVGEPVVVELLDANFVRTDGQRRPWEAWLVDMRQRCRACRAADADFPWVRPSGAMTPGNTGRGWPCFSTRRDFPRPPKPCWSLRRSPDGVPRAKAPGA